MKHLEFEILVQLTFFDRLCGFERTEDISPYGFKHGAMT